MVWGVILLIILDLSFGFWSYFLAKQLYKYSQINNCLKSDPLKIISLEAKKVWGSKEFIRAPKNL